VGLDDFAPQAFPADDGVIILAAARSRRERVDVGGEAPAEHDVVGGERLPQRRHDLCYGLLPSARTPLFERLSAKAPRQGVSRWIRQLAELQRHDYMLGHQCGTDTGAQPKKQHAVPVKGAQGLHDGVVHDANRLPECFFEVEGHPAISEVARLLGRPSSIDPPWVTD
jgi:hypothetical protein